MRRFSFPAALALALVFLAACGGGSDSPSTPQPASAGGNGVEWGVAGVIPPHFPAPTGDDYAHLFAAYNETGNLAGVYLNWADSPADEGNVPKGVASVNQAVAGRGIELVVALGATRDDGAGVRSTVNWADPAQRQLFMDTVRNVATTIQPPYLAIGVEVNRLWEADPAAFDQFVAGYREAYAVAKQASPATRVFTVFQLEMMNGKAFLAGGKDARQPEWDLLAKFDGALDAVGFTSYPFFDYETPQAIPADYYLQASAKAGLPVVLTELGWPSRPLSTAPGSGYGGSAAEQLAFVQRIPSLLEGSTVRAVLWAFPFDLGAGAPAPFESVALRESDGTGKPALVAWRNLVGH
jgi:hypothetical protein